jgi:choline-glycine betaine transporter
MDALQTAKNWIGALTDIALMLLALAIALALLVGPTLPFFGNVTAQLMNFVKTLGDGGLIGLIVLGIVLWLFGHRRLA